MDLFRLPTGCDLSIIGIPDIYNQSIITIFLRQHIFNVESSGLCIIEWPQRINEKSMPNSYLRVKITMPINSTKRVVHLLPHGKYWREKMILLTSILSKLTP